MSTTHVLQPPKEQDLVLAMASGGQYDDADPGWYQAGTLTFRDNVHPVAIRLVSPDGSEAVYVLELSNS